MASILGIGGVFFKADAPDMVREWYGRVLKLDVQPWGGVVFQPLSAGYTVWSPFAADTPHFEPSASDVMINFVVDDIDGVLAHAAGHDVPPLARDDTDANGRFA